jgi:hypothetical protein
MLTKTLTATTLALALGMAAPFAIAEDKAPMPQTRGMQGMDPAAHDKWAKEGEQAQKGCTPSAQKTAAASEHPMPDTKGMKGMDPKAHEVDCPEVQAAKPDPAKHVHKSGVN